jgi:hypothetical protein
MTPRPTPRLIALNAPEPVSVRVDGRGTPLAVLRGRHWVPVSARRERWRIDDEWWRRRVSRSYHVVVLDDGTLLTLFRDDVNGRWYRQG